MVSLPSSRRNLYGKQLLGAKHQDPRTPCTNMKSRTAVLAATCGLVIGCAAIYHVKSGVTNAAGGGKGAGIPQWERTQTSHLCGCARASASNRGPSPSIIYDLVRTEPSTCVSGRRNPKRKIRVSVDRTTWVGREFPLGEYACPRSICRIIDPLSSSRCVTTIELAQTWFRCLKTSMSPLPLAGALPAHKVDPIKR